MLASVKRNNLISPNTPNSAMTQEIGVWPPNQAAVTKGARVSYGGLGPRRTANSTSEPLILIQEDKV
jgi:hypothetical protein